MLRDRRRAKVVHVSAYYPPHLGGVERVAAALARRLTASYDVEVWTSRTGRLPDAQASQRIDGVLVRRLPAMVVAHTPLPLGLIRRLLSLRSNSVVHVHVAQALWPELVVLAAMVRRFSVVAHFHLDVDPTGPAGRLLPLYKRHLLGPALRRADLVIALTPSQATMLRQEYGIARDHLVVMANGVEDEFFSLVPAARPAEAPLRLLFVGRLEAQKNVPRLLQAVAAVTAPVELVVVGDGALRSELEQDAQRMGLGHVRFVGAKHGVELQDWYSWADVFVLSSDREGMPLALLEAIVTGLAVVSTDVSDLATQVGDAGLVVPADHAALAAAITGLAVDRALLASYRRSSRARAAALSWDPLVARLTELYEGLAA